MRVVQVSCHVDPLGREPEALLRAWPTLRMVAEAASGAGLEVEIVQAASCDHELRRAEVGYHFVRESVPSSLRRSAGLWAAPLTRRVCDRVLTLEPDVVHFHSLSYPRHLHLLRRVLPRAPILVQDHKDAVPALWRHPLTRRGLAHVSGAAFTAREQAHPWVEAGLLAGDLPIFEVLESSSTFTPGEAALARARTGSGGDPHLIWVGHLNRNKDPLTFLEALSRVADQLPDPQLWCCFGSAPLLDRVRRRVGIDPALEGRVHLVGPQPHEEVEHWLRAADFLVLGSHREGSGYAVIEALACGATPLITDIPSFRRITGGGAVGSLVPPGDVEAMARALLDWSRRDRRELRLRARAHFERSLSFDVVGRELRAAYRALVIQSAHPNRRGAWE